MFTIPMLWPILVVVAANTLYNICAKSAPADVQPFASLTVTYLIAAAASLGMFFLSCKGKSFAGEISRLNWTTLIFGLAIVGLEFGYLEIYRAGWKISVGTVVANVALACVLLLVGLLLYRETVSPRQLAGLALCVGGIVLLAR